MSAKNRLLNVVARAGGYEEERKILGVASRVIPGDGQSQRHGALRTKNNRTITRLKNSWANATYEFNRFGGI